MRINPKPEDMGFSSAGIASVRNELTGYTLAHLWERRAGIVRDIELYELLLTLYDAEIARRRPPKQDQVAS
jgi:hypothetical protein